MENPSPSQDNETQNLAYSRAYHLLGDITLRGPVEELLTYIGAIPELAAALPDTGPDELAADHYQTFGLEVHPYQSAFLEPERVVGGRVTENVLAAYLQAGYSPPSHAEAADHLGWELRFLADLCGREAQVADCEDTVEVSRLRNWQYRFLGEHLLTWLPALLQALRQGTVPFYGALAEFTLALAAAHYGNLAAWAVDSPRPFVLPEPPDLLSDQKTGLRDIAEYLITPAYTGVYVSRLDIQRLAKGQRLPRGFGDRRHMLTSLLRNAAEYERLPALLAVIRGYVEDWGRGLEALAGAPSWGDALAPFLRPWVERAVHTAELLGEIERLASNSQQIDP